MAFPTSILSLADAIGSQFLNLFWGGSVAHSVGVNQIKADLIATETKLGTGASTATANTVLRGTGTGTTAFGQIVSADITDGTIVNADISASAAIVYSKLSLSASIVSGDIVDGTIVNADLSASAAIAVSKLAAGSTNSVLTSNGSTDAFSATPTVTSLTTTGAVTSGTKIFPGTLNGPSPGAQAAANVQTAYLNTALAGNTSATIASFPIGSFWVFNISQAQIGEFRSNSVSTLTDRGSDAAIQIAGADPGTSTSKLWISLASGTLTIFNRFAAAQSLQIIGFSAA